MPKFRLAARVVVSAYTTVEAATLEEAIEASKGRPVEFGGNRSYPRSDYWLIDEAAGAPTGIVVDPD